MKRVRRVRNASAAHSDPGTQLTAQERELLARAEETTARFSNRLFADMYLESVRRQVVEKDNALFRFMKHLHQPPVPIEEFLDSDEFLGATDITVWPVVRQTIIDLNKDWWRGLNRGAYNEAVLAGSTSIGKTFLAQVTMLYHLHILGCLKSPQALYGLPSATTIIMPIMAAKPAVTKRVVYQPMRKMAEDIPWFRRHMRIDKNVDSSVIFLDKNIHIVPAGSDADSVLGEAVICAMMDEANFFNIVLRSKRAEVSSGRAGIYDQAAMVYGMLSRRIKSRFIARGPKIGMLIVSSSTRYKGDFTDKRIDHVVRGGEKNVYIYNKAQYDVWPQDRYSGEKFRLLIGNEELMDTRVLEDDEKVPDGAQVLSIPVEYKDDFIKSPFDSLRDVVGISTSAISPFFKRRFKILECVAAGEEVGLESFVEKDNVILGLDGLPLVKKGHYCQNPSRPRYVHIDLSLTNDRAGIAMVRFDGLRKVTRDGGLVEMMPECSVELAVSIEPDAQNEIQIAELRMWVKTLRDVYGYPIKVVTYDGYNCVSVNSMVWTARGFVRAGDVKVGDIVQSRIGPRPVVNKFAYGKRPVLKVRTAHGYEIACTHQHRIEACVDWQWIGTGRVGRDGREGNTKVPVWDWVRVDELQPGQVVRIWDQFTEVDPDYVKLQTVWPTANSRTTFEMPLRLTEEVALALGIIWGDGHISAIPGKGAVCVTGLPEDIEDAISILDEAFSFDARYSVVRKRGSRTVSVSVSCQHFVEWLRANGFVKPAVPEAILASPVSVQAAFICGLFSTDGSVKPRDGQVSYSTVHKDTATYVQTALATLFGIHCNRTVVNPSAYFGRPNSKSRPDRTEHYVLQIRGDRQYLYDCVGFAYRSKAQAIEQHLAVPGRIIYTKIAECIPSTADVVDFEVEDDPSYVVDGFVSHNSAESMQQWRKHGVKTGQVSVDRTSVPYKQLRDAINDNRILLYPQDTLIRELFELEYDDKHDKIDHPPTGTKDVADAVCAAYHTLVKRRSSWLDAASDDAAYAATARKDYADRHDEARFS